MLVVAFALVLVMMRQLRQPETAASIGQVFSGGPATAAAAVPADEAVILNDEHPRDGVFVQNNQLQRLLDLAGWDAERLAAFGDGQPLTDDERQDLLDLVRRLKTFDAAELADWTQTDWSFADVAAQPDEHRGELVKLTGRVRQVYRRVLPPDIALRLELPAYVECEMELDGGRGRVAIITARVPNVWNEMDELDESATASGLFVKLLPEVGEQAAALFVSPEIAWYPRAAREPFVSFGESLLGTLGMDVGLLDAIEQRSIKQRRSIKATERETFYQMLAAAGRAGANQLIRFADGNLAAVAAEWAAESKRLTDLAAGSADGADRKRQLLAAEVVRRADEGRYSVAPLFNDPENQLGRLVLLDGVARRAVRIDVGTAPDGTPSDVQRRFGIDHYFEVDLFTDDSQNNPVVFCVRELPPGFPTGESIREPVRLAGFFFKSWSFPSRRRIETATSSDGGGVTLQFAPLLVGRGPIWLQTSEASGNGVGGMIFGGLFVLVLAAVWGAVWWFGRQERRFYDRALADRFTLPPGESLDDVDVSPAAPSRDTLPTPAGTDENPKLN